MTQSVTAQQSTRQHLLQRLLLEELVRKRRCTDHERYTETFRRCAVDPNPHQVEAVAFALGRLEQGGALLCDEVGLGKTIETGLLLTQLRTEGRGHVLIIVPVPLARQWQVELRDLFSLKSVVVGATNLASHQERGIYIAGREFAGSPKWAPILAGRGPWDLVVVDEAHDTLSTIYHRFGRKDGCYNENPKKGQARRAALIKTVAGPSPLLLLTATPLQNSLLELWGLVHFVDPSATVLGHLPEFARLFTVNDGRAINPDNQDELRGRIRGVMCRTLRSQAQPFLRTPFTARHCETINFHMQAAERELYLGVSNWLTGKIAAYRASQQRMMALMLRRRMGSSVQALAASLTRLRNRMEGSGDEAWEPDEETDMELVEADIRELIRLEKLAQKALRGSSPKLESLWELIERIEHGAMRGVASDKLVVFTESRRTLEAIVEFLDSKGLRGLVTAFSGTNDSPAAQTALENWERQVGVHLDPSQRPERSSAVRAALVHEFKTRTRVLVATEAGAKGLNLQFCNCLVNFDLPWNPQRIEQRIGRVHRYGQLHDVVIVNFINLDNEGEERVYQLLRDKLQLFEGLLGASDAILGQVASALDFEKRVFELITACRTPAERQREFDRLELELDEQTRRLHDQRLQRARSLIADLDEDVQARLRLTAEALPVAMSRRDETFLRLLDVESPVRRLGSDGERVIFEWRSRRYHMGPPNPSDGCGEPLDLEHPLVLKLLEQARTATDGGNFRMHGSPHSAWTVFQLTVSGLETEEQLMVIGPGGKEGLYGALEAAESVSRLEQEWSEEEDVQEEAELEIRDAAEQAQSKRIQSLLQQLAARKDDVRRCIEQRESELKTEIGQAERKHRTARDADEMKRALSSLRRANEQLETLQRDRDARVSETASAIAKKEAEIHQRRYVNVTSRPLFRLERVP